jgi:molecular chaperone DnaK (HSP70)
VAGEGQTMKRRSFLSSLAASGLAIIAGCLHSSGIQPRRKVLATDVGLKTLAGFTPLVRKGAEIPASYVNDFSTSEDNQRGVTLTLFTRNPETGELTELGEFNIENIEQEARGMPRIRVSLSVIDSGKVVVVAHDETTGNTKKVEFGPVQIQEQ